MNSVNWFKKLTLPEVVSLVDALSGVPVVTSYIASTDTAQKAHISYKLSNLKLEKPCLTEKV